MSPQSKVALLSARALVRVAGSDWRGFLQGLITQDVETLSPGELRYAALLTPQGRLLHDLFVLGTEDGAVLDVQAAQREALIQRLTLYRLRAKVEIVAEEGRVLAAWGDHADPPSPSWGGQAARSANGVGLSDRTAPGPPGDLPHEGEAGWARDPRLPALGWRGYAVAEAASVSEDAYDAHRLALGAPDPAKDCPDDKTYPIEANFDLLNGIDFKKGCFVGQETTSRMKRRGAIKSRTVPLAFDGPPPTFGAELLAGTLRAGEVRSGRAGRALALVRLDRAMGTALTAEGRPVRLDLTEWLTAAIGDPALAETPD